MRTPKRRTRIQSDVNLFFNSAVLRRFALTWKQKFSAIRVIRFLSFYRQCQIFGIDRSPSLPLLKMKELNRATHNARPPHEESVMRRKTPEYAILLSRQLSSHEVIRERTVLFIRICGRSCSSALRRIHVAPREHRALETLRCNSSIVDRYSSR